MKKLITLFLLFSLSKTSFSQLGEMTKDDVARIQSSITYFVLDDESETKYNLAVKENANLFWKLTKFEFITFSQLQDYIQKPNSNFVMRLIFEYNSGKSIGDWTYASPEKRFEKDYLSKPKTPSLEYRYDGIVLVNVKGGRKKPQFGWNDWMAYSIINDVNAPENYYFKMGAYLQVVQNFVSYFQNSGEKSINLSKGKEYYNIGKEQFKNKLLYIRKADMPKGMTEISKIKEIYKYQVKFASDLEIQNAITNKDPKVIILHHTESGNRYYPYFTETETGKVVYLDMDRNYSVNPAKSVKKLLQEISE